MIRRDHAQALQTKAFKQLLDVAREYLELQRLRIERQRAKMEQKEETTRSTRLILFDISEVFAQECDFVCERGVALDEIANSSIGIDYGGVVSVPEVLSNEGEGRLRESAAQIDCNVSWVHEAEIAMMREEFVDGDVVVGCAQFLDIEDGGREGV